MHGYHILHSKNTHSNLIAEKGEKEKEEEKKPKNKQEKLKEKIIKRHDFIYRHPTSPYQEAGNPTTHYLSILGLGYEANDPRTKG